VYSHLQIAMDLHTNNCIGHAITVDSDPDGQDSFFISMLIGSVFMVIRLSTSPGTSGFTECDIRELPLPCLC
jgi:hypothetical protein